MPNKTSKNKPSALPTIPKELIDQIVDGPMTAEAVNVASMAFKKALIERAPEARLHQSPSNALIELVLRQGLDQQIVAVLPGGFPQRRAVRQGDARRIDRLAKMGEYLPDHFAFVDEGDDLHRAAAFRAEEGEHFVDARQQHGPHKPCCLTGGRFLRFGLGFALPSSVAIAGDYGAATSAVTALGQGGVGC